MVVKSVGIHYQAGAEYTTTLLVPATRFCLSYPRVVEAVVLSLSAWHNSHPAFPETGWDGGVGVQTAPRVGGKTRQS